MDTMGFVISWGPIGCTYASVFPLFLLDDESCSCVPWCCCHPTLIDLMNWVAHGLCQLCMDLHFSWKNESILIHFISQLIDLIHIDSSNGFSCWLRTLCIQMHIHADGISWPWLMKMLAHRFQRILRMQCWFNSSLDSWLAIIIDVWKHWH